MPEFIAHDPSLSCPYTDCIVPGCTEVKVLDLQRLRYDLMPVEFDDVVQVLQHSAHSGKYGENDWLNGVNFEPEKNLASIKRHIRDYRLGNRADKDNGLHPMLMVACRALMQYTLDVRSEKDVR